MTAITAIFFVLIFAEGKQPYQFQQEMPLADCLYEVNDILSKQSAAFEGVRMQAGCSITIPRSLPAAGEEP